MFIPVRMKNVGCAWARSAPANPHFSTRSDAFRDCRRVGLNRLRKKPSALSWWRHLFIPLSAPPRRSARRPSSSEEGVLKAPLLIQEGRRLAPGGGYSGGNGSSQAVVTGAPQRWLTVAPGAYPRRRRSSAACKAPLFPRRGEKSTSPFFLLPAEMHLTFCRFSECSPDIFV